MYKIGRHSVAIFGGADMWEILDPNGARICQVVGLKSDAEELIKHLNREAYEDTKG
jgi:hypothetical protein